MTEPKIKMAERMGDLIAAIVREYGTCTDDDLRQAGFTDDHIRQCGPLAQAFAATAMTNPTTN